MPRRKPLPEGNVFIPFKGKLKLEYASTFFKKSNRFQRISYTTIDHSSEFFRIRPGNGYQLSVAVIEEVEGMNKTLWLIYPSLLQKLSDEVSYFVLRLAVNHVGIPFLWPLKISRDGGSNSWNQSTMIAAEAATKKWVRIRPNCQVGQYDIIVAKNNPLEPIWPDMSFQEILKSAFKGRIITDYNHPLLRQLRGEI